MHSLRQRRCRRKTPLAVFVHRGAANGDTVIEDLHAGVWFSAAAERRTGVVSRLARGERTGYAAGIVCNGVQDRRLWPAEINYQRKAGRKRPAVARRVGCRGGDDMGAVAQRLRRGQGPVACIGDRHYQRGGRRGGVNLQGEGG